MIQYPSLPCVSESIRKIHGRLVVKSISSEDRERASRFNVTEELNKAIQERQLANLN